jgi:PAS domain S-box-containing protein
MPQQSIELILLRQWASYVSVPIFIVGVDGQLLYYNDAAAKLLGQSYEDVEDLSVSMLADTFQTVDAAGQRLPWDELPIGIAVSQRRPAHGPLRFRGIDGVWHTIEVTAIPIEGAGQGQLAVAAFFWEVPGS